MVIQSDGKYIIVGYSYNISGNSDTTIWRYNSDGTLDTTFNGTGFASHNSAAGGNNSDNGTSLAIQSDGKYVIGGLSVNSLGNSDLAVWRYNIDGTLDTSFNGIGYATHHNAAGGNSDDYSRSIGIQMDGKIVITGYSMSATSGYDIAVWRYNTDGTLDTSFNGIGYVTHSSAAGGNGTDATYGLAIQSDGKILVVGSSLATIGGLDMTIWRFNTDGTLDTTFNGIGYATHNNAAGGNGHDIASSIAIQQDGKYIVAGQSINPANRDLAIWRFNSNGTLDTTFNGIGYVTHNNAAGGNGHDFANSIAIQQNGKYVVAGNSPSIANGDLAIWRFNTDGTLDSTFNETGYIIHNGAAGGNGADWGYSIAIQLDGKYIIAGQSLNASSNDDLAIWRYVNEYQIDQLPIDYDAKILENNIETGNPYGAYGEQIVRLEKNSYPIADITADLIKDLNWSSVSADISFTESKSFVHNITNIEGADATFTLYVPYKSTHNAVFICPQADSLDDLISSCSDGYSLDENDSNVSIVTISGQNYWKVENLSGTGGFGFENLILSGQKVVLPVLIGFILLFAFMSHNFLIRKNRKKLFPLENFP